MGPRGREAGRANAMHSQKEQKAMHGIRSAYAEQEHGEGCQSLSGLRHHTARHCTCRIQVQVGHV